MKNSITVVKFGTNTLLDLDGNIHHEIFEQQGTNLDKHTGDIVLVSSGAVGFGKALTTFESEKDEVLRKRSYAKKGNPHLAQKWDESIKSKDVLQCLVTYKDLLCQDFVRSIQSDLRNGAIPLLNYNDAVSDAELKKLNGGSAFGDNDHLSVEVSRCCSQFNHQINLIICTNTDGILDEFGQTIPSLAADELDDDRITQLCGKRTSTGGTGGMKTKATYSRDLLLENESINSVQIINGTKPYQLQQALQEKLIGTLITV